jgi:putative flippase GtrA
MPSEVPTPVCEHPEAPPVSPKKSSKIAALLEKWQIARYMLVGVWNTLFGYACYAGFVTLYSRLLPSRDLPLTVDLASITATPLGITMAFFCYKFFVFRTKGNYFREWLRCITVYGSATIPGLFALPVLTKGLQQFASVRTMAPYLAGAIVTAVTTLYTYFAHKNFSFAAPKTAPEA